ncbi:MAG TPA: hypothetical protein VGK30_05585 [Candidatus Binatia bacterium]|jgi:hypothetical protein
MRYACVLALILLFPGHARSADIGHITQCFTSVLPRQIAMLDVDLVCPSYPGNEIPIIGLQSGSRLLLNGHTIDGGDIGVGAKGKGAVIEGPGAIRGMAAYGILTDGKMKISDVVVDGNGWGIFSRYEYSLKLKNVTVSNSVEYGITMGSPVLGKGAISAKNLTVDDNGKIGVEGQKVSINGVHATGNGYSGVVGTTRVRLKNGVVSGNGAQGFAGFERVDVTSFLKAPKLLDVACDHSSNDVGVAWGVCGLDP